MPYVKKAVYKPRARVAASSRPRAPYRKPAQSRSKYSKSRYLAPGLGALGGLAGTYFGGPAGGLAGTAMGNLAGEGIKALTGFGDYTVRSNTLAMGRPPSIHNKSRAGGSVVMSHKEYIGDIVSSSVASTFKIESFPLQPGSDKTFPWLSQIAANFQEFKFNGLVFHFRSMSADALNSTNTALGSLVMSTEYNAAAPAFVSKSEMENAQFSNSIKPSDSCLHLIECARQSTVLSNLYVRTDDVDSSSQDIRFYDLGNFYIASTGCQGTSVNLGELWVSYEVELFKPKLWAELGETISFFNGYSLTGITNAVPFGTDQLIESSNNTISVRYNPAANTLTLPASSAPKSYAMYLRWRGSRTASLDPPGIVFTNSNATSGNPLLNTIGPPVVFAAAVSTPDTNVLSDSLLLNDMVFFQTVGNNAVPVLTFAATGVLPITATAVQIIIIQVPNTYDF